MGSGRRGRGSNQYVTRGAPGSGGSRSGSQQVAVAADPGIDAAVGFGYVIEPVVPELVFPPPEVLATRYGERFRDARLVESSYQQYVLVAGDVAADGDDLDRACAAAVKAWATELGSSDDGFDRGMVKQAAGSRRAAVAVVPPVHLWREGIIPVDHEAWSGTAEPVPDQRKRLVSDHMIMRLTERKVSQ